MPRATSTRQATTSARRPILRRAGRRRADRRGRQRCVHQQPDEPTVADFTSVNHNVTLTVDNTTNVGIIRAHNGLVTITSQNNVVDLDDGAAANIEALSVDLNSIAGSVGTTDNPFDIDTSYGGTLGTVNAQSFTSVFHIETTDEMRVDEVRSETSKVWLRTLPGSILDANAADNNVTEWRSTRILGGDIAPGNAVRSTRPTRRRAC